MNYHLDYEDFKRRADEDYKRRVVAYEKMAADLGLPNEKWYPFRNCETSDQVFQARDRLMNGSIAERQLLNFSCRQAHEKDDKKTVIKKTNDDPYGVKKLKAIQAIVKEKQLAMGFSPLSDRLAEAQAETWLPHMQNIPTDRLRDVYKEAMSARDPKTPFSPTDMLQAWRQLKEREAYNAEVGSL